MQSSSGLINIHELRWLRDWLVVPAGGRGRQAHNNFRSFVWQANVSFSAVSDMWKIFIQLCNKSHILTYFRLAIANNTKHNN